MNIIKKIPQSSILKLTATSQWARRYTQVYDTSDSIWFNGCYVEEVHRRLTLHQAYFKPGEHFSSEDLSTIEDSTVYSSKYSDHTWRKDSAVLGLLDYYCEEYCRRS